jgi:hypothetical protein
MDLSELDQSQQRIYTILQRYLTCYSEAIAPATEVFPQIDIPFVLYFSAMQHTPRDVFTKKKAQESSLRDASTEDGAEIAEVLSDIPFVLYFSDNEQNRRNELTVK